MGKDSTQQLKGVLKGRGVRGGVVGVGVRIVKFLPVQRIKLKNRGMLVVILSMGVVSLWGNIFG